MRVFAIASAACASMISLVAGAYLLSIRAAQPFTWGRTRSYQMKK